MGRDVDLEMPMTKIRTQISVHMENRPGALAELTEALHVAGVNIEAIAVPDTGEFGTVRLVPDDVLRAREALQEVGWPHAAADVLEVLLPHRPGALALMARILADEQVVIRYAYSTIEAGSEDASCILQVDDIHKAVGALNRKLR